MALTIISGAETFSAPSELDAHQLVPAVVGCNIAWGVIDAILFVLGSMFYRSQRARFFRGLRIGRSEAEPWPQSRKSFGAMYAGADFRNWRASAELDADQCDLDGRLQLSNRELALECRPALLPIFDKVGIYAVIARC